MSANIVVRALELGDLQDVLDIERLCYPIPWSEEQFRQEIVNPVSSFQGIFVDDILAGYICCWLIAGELQILNVAVSPRYRRRGVAVRLINHAFDRARQVGGLDTAWLEVRVGNTAAITLYESMGFAVNGRRKKYYRDGEDALLMQKLFDSLGSPEVR